MTSLIDIENLVQILDNLQKKHEEIAVYDDLFNYRSGTDLSVIYSILNLKVYLIKTNQFELKSKQEPKIKVTDILEFMLNSVEMRPRFANLIKELFKTEKMDFNDYKQLFEYDVNVILHDLDLVNMLLEIRDNYFSHFKLTNFEQLFWTQIFKQNNYDFLLLPFNISKFGLIDKDKVEDLILTLLSSDNVSIATKSICLLRKLIEAEIFDERFRSFSLLIESFDENSTKLSAHHLDLLPNLRQLDFKWTLCLLQKCSNLNINWMNELRTFLHHCLTTSSQQEICLLFEKGKLFDLFNKNPAIFDTIEIIEDLNLLFDHVRFNMKFSIHNFENTFLTTFFDIKTWNPVTLLVFFILSFQHDWISSFHINIVKIANEIAEKRLNNVFYRILPNTIPAYNLTTDTNMISRLCFKKLQDGYDHVYKEFVKFHLDNYKSKFSLMFFGYLLDLIAINPLKNVTDFLNGLQFENKVTYLCEFIKSQFATEVITHNMFVNESNLDELLYCCKSILYYAKVKNVAEYLDVSKTKTCNHELMIIYDQKLNQNSVNFNFYRNNDQYLNVFLRKFNNLPKISAEFVRFLFQNILDIAESKYDQQIADILVLTEKYHNSIVSEICNPYTLRSICCFLNCLSREDVTLPYHVLFVELFKSFDDEYRPKYAHNSITHHKLTRIVQCLLLIESRFPKHAKTTLNMVFNKIKDELNQHQDHQKSVKFFLIWLLSNMYKHLQYSAAEIRTIKDDENVLLLSYFVWITSRFNVICRENLFNLCSKYLLHDQCSLRFLAANLLRNYFKRRIHLKVEMSLVEKFVNVLVVDKLNNNGQLFDPLIDNFDPVEMWSLKTLFVEIPRLCGLHKSSWIQINWATDGIERLSFIPFENQ